MPEDRILPIGFQPIHTSFFMIHGVFGEDGELQNTYSKGMNFWQGRCLECLCIDKFIAKERVKPWA